MQEFDNNPEHLICYVIIQFMFTLDINITIDSSLIPRRKDLYDVC